MSGQVIEARAEQVISCAGVWTEEVSDLGESFEVQSEATDVVAVRTALQEAGIDYDSAEAQFVPSMEVTVDAEGRVARGDERG